MSVGVGFYHHNRLLIGTLSFYAVQIKGQLVKIDFRPAASVKSFVFVYIRVYVIIHFLCFPSVYFIIGLVFLIKMW